MEILNTTKSFAYPSRNKQIETNNQRFEQMWGNAISGDEFVRRIHKRIDEMYARNKQKITLMKILLVCLNIRFHFILLNINLVCGCGM